MENVTYQTLKVEFRNHTAYITLNRPEAANSFNVEMAKELMYALLECEEASEVRVVVITGQGKMFSAGGDLKSFVGSEKSASYNLKEVTTYLHGAISRIARMEKPVIIAVNGVAAGAGMSLVCAGDIVIAAESARFTMAYTRAGLTPDGSSTYFLPRLVGQRRALELAITNRMLSAQEAYEWGIVNRVVTSETLVQETETLANELAQGAIEAFGATKKLMYTGWNETLETQMEKESRSIAKHSISSEGNEGISAFLEKRSPKFVK